MSPLAPATRALVLVWPKSGHAFRAAAASRELRTKRRREILFIAVLFGVYEFFIAFSDFGLLLIAFMDIKAITEGDTLARGDEKVARVSVRQIFKEMFAKGVRGEQAVIAHVPCGWMPRI